MIVCETDGPEFYNWTEQRAKKVYVCCECSSPINQGEKYGKAFGKWEGNLGTWRQHLLCANACMLIRDSIQFECVPFGSLHEFFSEGYATKSNRYMFQLRKMYSEILRRKRGSTRA